MMRSAYAFIKLGISGLCGVMASVSLACAADVVKAGFTGNTGDVGFFVADERGYFKQEGIEFQQIYFDSGARMIAPLGTGDLDVGSAPANVGLYNAAARKIDVRVVADRGRTAKNNMYQTVMIRKDLIESGRFKDYRDLKGLKFAFPAPGVSSLSVFNEALKKGGLTFADAEKTFMGYPQQVVAFQNKAIDGSMMIEPFGTALVDMGSGVRFAPTEDFYPDDQISMIVYGDRLTKDRPEVARRFMKAYVRAIRDFNDALDNGRWRNTPKADEVVRILARRLELKEEQIRRAYPHAVDPDGRVNTDSMRKDLAFFRQIGDVADPTVTVETILDESFVLSAVRDLGLYRPAP